MANHMLKSQSYLIAWVIFVGLTGASCSNSDNAQHRLPVAANNSPAVNGVVSVAANTANDELALVLQKSIDYEKLQSYYHVATSAERKPLYIVLNKIVVAKLGLTKFGEAVVFATCNELRLSKKPYVEVTTADIFPKNAKIVFRYYVEGIEVTLDFVKEKELWRLSSGQLNEKRFSDNGCNNE
jgi:hypothetical protein